MKIRSVLLITFLSIQVAQSQVLINVDFGGGFFSPSGPVHTGAAVVGSAGDQWNSFDNTGQNISGLGGALNDSTGSASGAILTFNGSFLFNDTDTAYTGPAGSLMQDYLGIRTDFNGGVGTLTLTGLDTNAAYTLHTYSQPDVGGRQTTFAVDGGSSQTTSASDAAASALVLGQNYLVFTGTTNGSGTMTINYSVGTGEGAFNGFQLEVVPEPSTWTLLLAGALSLFLLRKQKRKLG
ncbi:MAG: PEP-CTERM sorting domain-containing protein [Verrucomicrobiota bacterium]